jgi:plastocyanin
MKRTATIFFVMGVLFLSANAYAAIVDVSIVNFSFVPQTVTVNTGDSVRWTNNDSTAHTTTSGMWDSGILQQGAQFSFTFNSPGSFPYFCSIHSFMTGTITVIPASAVPVPTGQQAFPPYAGIASPVTNVNPALMEPVAVGAVATGGSTVDLAVNTGAFAGLVDMYFAIYAPALSPEIFLLTPAGLQPLSTAGLVAWNASVPGVNVALFGSIPKALLPAATYNLLLAVTPAGNVSSFYLWQTAFVLP